MRALLLLLALHAGCASTVRTSGSTVAGRETLHRGDRVTYVTHYSDGTTASFDCYRDRSGDHCGM